MKQKKQAKPTIETLREKVEKLLDERRVIHLRVRDDAQRLLAIDSEIVLSDGEIRILLQRQELEAK